MSFWNGLSATTKGVIIVGGLLWLVVLIVRMQEPDEDAPVPPPGVPRGANAAPAAPTGIEQE